MARLKTGQRITISGGKYDGHTGTILKINNIRHKVEVDEVGIGWVTRSLCSLIPEDQPTLSRDKDRNSSRLSATVDSFPRVSPTHIPNMSDSTDTGRSLEPRHSSDVTTQVLLDLLANSIAVMNLNDDHIDEWTQQLRERIIYFCHGTL